MVKKYLLPAIAIFGGIVGILLRRWQLATAFELDTGLPISGSPATIAIGLLSVLVAAVLLLFALRERKADRPSLTYYQGFHAKSFVYLLLVVFAAALTLIAALFYFHTAMFRSFNRLNQPAVDVLMLILSIFALLGAVSLLLIAFRNYGAKASQNGSLLLLMPGFAACLWLMVAYQGWARDPIVSDYVFALFAIMSGMLAHYFIASYSFSKPRLGPVCVTAMLAVYFSLVALTNTMVFADRCMFLAQIFYLTPTVVVLCRNSGQRADTEPALEPEPDQPLKEDIP